MRLIDADMTDVIIIYDKGNELTQVSVIREYIEKQREFLDKFPTVDAVPVVRCKDCIRRYDTDECPMCFLIEGKYYEYTNGNGFCDRGERKEGADL